MREITALGYIGISVPDVEAWARFATQILGVQVIGDPADNTVRLRYDDRDWRIQVDQGPELPGVNFIGWEVATKGAFDELVSRLGTEGIDVKEDPALARVRKVARVAVCVDPNGFQTEFFYGAPKGTLPFVSPTGARFVTGEQGLGHCVIMSTDPAATEDFYMRVLRFGASDEMHMGPMLAQFTHVNSRHHSFAYMPSPFGVPALNHIMIEVDDMTTVGTAYDRAKAAGLKMMMELGEHTNDRMKSFYVFPPTGTVAIEYGFDGLQIDQENWTYTTLDSGDIWGHEKDPSFLAGALPPVP